MSIKRRLLALVLVLVMVLSWIPASAVARRPGAAMDDSQSSGGRLGLTASSGNLKQDTGFAPGRDEGLSKFEQSELLPYSQQGVDVFEADDLVTFVVTLESEPLLKLFSAEEIAEQGEAVQAYRQAQEQLVEAARAITDDLQARYDAYTVAEAFLIENALIVPYGYDNGGYTASRLNPFESQFAPFGISNERYKGQTLLDAPMSTDQYWDAYDAWLEERAKIAEAAQ